MVIAFLMWNPFHHSVFDREKNNCNPGGEYNGYVAFDTKLPLSFQGGSNDVHTLDDEINVHGGITFDDEMTCLENAAIIPLTAIPSPNELKNYRCIGFDTVHYGDTLEKWPIEAVKKETLNLKKQIEDLIVKQQKG